MKKLNKMIAMLVAACMATSMVTGVAAEEDPAVMETIGAGTGNVILEGTKITGVSESDYKVVYKASVTLNEAYAQAVGSLVDSGEYIKNLRFECVLNDALVAGMSASELNSVKDKFVFNSNDVFVPVDPNNYIALRDYGEDGNSDNELVITYKISEDKISEWINTSRNDTPTAEKVKAALQQTITMEIADQNAVVVSKRVVDAAKNQNKITTEAKIYITYFDGDIIPGLGELNNVPAAGTYNIPITEYSTPSSGDDDSDGGVSAPSEDDPMSGKPGFNTEVVENKDGSTTTTMTDNKGNKGETNVTSDGKVSADVDLSKDSVEEAVKNDAVVELPVVDMPVTDKKEEAPSITIQTGVAENISVKVPVKEPTPGTVAMTVEADGTTKVIRDSVISEDGVLLNVTDGQTIIIVDNTKEFNDIADNYWGKDAVDFVSSRELFNGVGGNNFAPTMNTTRGMIAQVLHSLKNNPEADIDSIFADVEPHDWFHDAVIWAADVGVVAGLGNGLYGPEINVTREQLVTMLWSYAGRNMSKDRNHLDKFTDGDDVSGWAVDAMHWGLENTILGGKGNGWLDPTGLATRAEVAQMMKNFCEYMATR